MILRLRHSIGNEAILILVPLVFFDDNSLGCLSFCSYRTQYIMAMANYLKILDSPSARGLLHWVRCDFMPSKILEGRYKIAYSERICPCSLVDVETTEHVFFHCPYHKEIQNKMLQSKIHCRDG